MADGAAAAIPRHKIKVPIPLVLGHLEYLTDDELFYQLSDLQAEVRRRIDSREQADDDED